MKAHYEIVGAEQLIKTSKRTSLIETIRKSGELNLKDFNEMGLSLIKNMLHYTQQLPESSNRCYTLPGGLIDYSLNRTEAALALFRNYLLPNSHAPLTNAQKLWWYTLFSAAMLRGIGKLYLEYKISVYDKEGQVKQWDPLTTPLFPIYQQYTYIF